MGGGEGHEVLQRPCSFRIVLLHEALEDGEFGPWHTGKVERI